MQRNLDSIQRTMPYDTTMKRSNRMFVTEPIRDNAWNGLAIACILLFASIASAADHTKDSLDKIKERVKAKEAILVDVREKSEWDAGHIDGAKHIPMSEIVDKLTDEEILELLPKDKIIYLHCAGGYRCLDVAEKLENVHPNLRAMKQGYQKLLKAGFKKAEPEKDSPPIEKKQ